MPNIFTFVDYTGFLTEVFEEDLNFAGAWLSTVNYYRFDVVTYGSARWVCTTANTNTAPPTGLQFSQYWSIIAFTSTGTGSSGTNSVGASVQMVNDVYSLAYRAYQIALTGTDLPAPGGSAAWVMQWIGHTYNVARAGTDAAHSADMWGRDAFHIAVNGTNAANAAYAYAGQAYDIAVAGTDAAHSADSWGRDAFGLAVTGTNAANQAYSLARLALDTAWVGTNTGGGGLPSGAGTVPSWVMDWLAQTYNLSVAGTNAANSADMWARDAYGLAVTGTFAVNQTDLTARLAWNLAQTGTDAAHSADSWGRDAFGLAVNGTNAANQAYSLATLALQTAWVGTNTGGGSVDSSQFVHISGDTMTGTLGAKAVYLQHGTQAYSTGTVVIDFLDKAYQTVFMNGATAFDGTNYGAADSNRTISYRLFSGNASRTLSFNSLFVCLREKPSTIAAKKIAIASFTCFGTSPSDVVFAYAEQTL